MKAHIVRSAERLADHPLLGTETDETSVRELTIARCPYRVYYLVENGEVWIVHIRHTV